MRALAKDRMLHKALLVGLVLLLLGVGFFALLAGGAGPDLRAPGEPDGGVAAPGEPAAANVGATSPAADATGDAADDATRAVAAVFDEATQRPLPDDPQWVVVKIVDKASGAPVAGAVVHWYDETAWDYLADRHTGDEQERRELHWQGERFAELAGWRTRSDGKGLARVTAKEWTTVLAQHGALHGRLQLRGGTVPPVGGHLIELVPDVSVSVRVVDDRGVPCADVPITVAILDKDGNQHSPYGWSSLARSRAPDGIATIPHVQAMVSELQGNGEGTRKLEWRARLFLPGVTDKGVVFDPEHPPAEPPELRLPACGSLRVRAEFAGKPLPGFRTAWMSHQREGEGHRWEPQANLAARVGPDGQARFRFVPLGLQYQVGADAGGGVDGTFAGPVHAGQEVEVVLSPRDDAMLLSGRLLAADHAPVVERTVRVRATGPQFRAQPEVRTDRDGRFVVNVGSPRKDNRVDQLWFELHQKGEPPRRAEAAPRTLRPGIDELGDLVLGDGAIVVAGRIVAGEAPFTGQISLRVEREEPGDGTRPARWRRLDGQMEHKDGTGAFSIRGNAPAGRYRLMANSERTLPIPPIEFAPGATGVVVAVDPGQGLAASVLLPENAPTECLTAVLVPAVPPPTTPGNPEGRPEDRLKQQFEGRRGMRQDVRWPSVPGGTYTLELRLWAVARPLVAIPDVVLPGPAGGDPRLVDIDLRPLLRVVAFTLREPDGKAIENVDGVAFPGGQGNADEWLAWHLWSSLPRVLLPTGPYDLLLGVSGFRPQPVRGNSDQVDVRLDRWPTLEVVVPEIPALPDKTRVQVSLQPAERSELRYRTQWSSGERSEYLAPPRRNAAVVDGKASVPIGDGLYTLRLTVSANRRSHSLTGLEPAQVLSTAGQVTVRAPKAQWEKAIEVVKQPPPPQPQVPR